MNTEDKFYFGKFNFSNASTTENLIAQATDMLRQAEELRTQKKQAQAASVAAKIKYLLRNERDPRARNLSDEAHELVLDMLRPRPTSDFLNDRIKLTSPALKRWNEIKQYRIDYKVTPRVKAAIASILNRVLPFVAKATAGNVTIGEMVAVLPTFNQHIKQLQDLKQELSPAYEKIWREIRADGSHEPDYDQEKEIDFIEGMWKELNELSGLLSRAREDFRDSKENIRPNGGKFFSSRSSSRPGQPERFAIRLSDLNYAKSQIRSATPERLREIEQELLPFANGGHKEALALLAYLKSEWNERYRGTHSRPGQPERFMRDIPVKSWKKGAEDYEAGITEDSGRFQPYVNMPKRGTLVTRNAPTFKSEAGARKWLSEYLTKQGFSRPGQPERFGVDKDMMGTNKRIIRARGHEFLAEDEGNRTRISIKIDGVWEHATTVNTDNQTATEWIEANAKPVIRRDGLPYAFSRPGHPDKFDASSLNRGNFAEASSSPMLGKLLSEKQMPDGGWRAVETGGGALVISFEDADVAGNFARRVAGSGYSATAPVQSIGRYWNVEVKNGK